METISLKLQSNRKFMILPFRAENGEKTEVKEKKSKSGNPMKELAAKKKEKDAEEKSSSSLSSSEDEDH